MAELTERRRGLNRNEWMEEVQAFWGKLLVVHFYCLEEDVRNVRKKWAGVTWPRIQV